MQNIIDALSSSNDGTKYASGYCSEQTLKKSDIKLEVKEIGKVTFPLQDKTLDKLIAASTEAKFGHKDKTLLDKNVRDTCEIKPEDITLTINQKNFDHMLHQVRSDLGLANEQTLRAHLHNLLIYNKGQFFKKHQDTEKLDGMVATMVIVLPSAHIGGDLVVYHGDENQTFSSEHLSTDKLKCFAFYADCQHEVQKVTQGNRAVLTFNLVLDSAEKKQDIPSNKKLETALLDYFPDKGHITEEPIKLAFFLDHEYTQHSLKWNMLKGNDHKNAQALLNAAKNLDLVPHLALVEIHECWSTGFDEYYGGDDPELEELIDDDTTLNYWVDTNGKKVNYKECRLSEDEVCSLTETRDLTPYDSEYEGYMGNYGNTMDYWYRRAAVVLWRKEDHLALSFSLAYDQSLKKLLALTKKLGNQTQVKEMIDHAQKYLCKNQCNDETDCLGMLSQVATYTEDRSYAQKLLSHFALKQILPSSVQHLVKIVQTFGADYLLELMNSWEKEKVGTWYRRTNLLKNIKGIISALCDQSADSRIPEFLLNYQIALLIADDKLLSKESLSSIKKHRKDRLIVLDDLLHACLAVNDIAKIKTVTEHVIKYPALYPILDLAALAIRLKTQKKVKTDDCTFEKKIAERLKEIVDLGLRDENDLSIAAHLSCSCELCATASKFLQSKTDSEVEWPIVQADRKHVMERFKNDCMPVNLSVLKKGSPHKLVMQKHHDLYKKEKAAYQKVVAYYEKLQTACLR